MTQYLWRQSFWGDEVSLLNNISEKSFGELFTGGLEHGQAAPPLFLAAQKLLSLPLGLNEYSQRLLPMLMGAAAMAAFACLAWRILPPEAATLAAAALCFSDRFLWHCTEVKQYAGDVLCAILLTWMALQLRDVRRFFWLSVAAAALVWFSHTVVFVYAAISVLMLIRHRWRALACNAVFLVSFAALWRCSIRHQSNDAYLQEFWRQDLADWSRPLHIPLWLIHQLWSVGGYAMQPVGVAEAVLSALMIVGTISWITLRRWEILGLCLGPLAWLIAAAAARQYPLSGARVDFFVVPGLLMAAGQGFLVLPGRGWKALAVAVLLIPMLALDARAVVLPRVRMNLRPVAEQLRARFQPGEVIYADQVGDVLRWYWPNSPPVIDRVPIDRASTDWFWYVIAGKPENLMREEETNLKAISHHATEIVADRITVRGGAAFHFREDSFH
jgi:hypothetical protein